MTIPNNDDKLFQICVLWGTLLGNVQRRNGLRSDFVVVGKMAYFTIVMDNNKVLFCRSRWQ